MFGTYGVITNEKVTNLLLKTLGHKSFKKDFHIELITMYRGHVTQVFYIGNDLMTKFFTDNQYWTIISVIANAIIFSMKNLWYHDLHEMIVPTDLGMPAIFSNRVPNLFLFDVITDVSDTKSIFSIKLEVEARLWRHGSYEMAVYNPIADVFHTVSRVTSADLVVPIEVTVSYNTDTKSIKIKLPRLSATKHSVGGLKTLASNHVTISDDENHTLKEHCPTCKNVVIATKGLHNKRNYIHIIDSKDTGLEYSMRIFNCESDLTPFTNVEEWGRVFLENKNLK